MRGKRGDRLGSGQRVGGSGQRVGGLGKALHVVGRRLQGVLLRRGALEDLARLAEAVRGGGGAGAGLAAGMGGVAPEPWPM